MQMKKYQIPATEVTRTMPFTVVCYSWDGYDPNDPNKQNPNPSGSNTTAAPWRF